MIFEEHISCAPFTTFGVGGSARFFCRIRDTDDCREVMHFKNKNNLDLFILGGGSNILVSDAGFSGIVAKIEIKGVIFSEDSHDGGDQNVIRIEAGAGENWDDLVALTAARGLFGLVNLSGIPGTVGASAVQNIGAYGVEAKDMIKWVEVFDMTSGNIRRLTNEECTFKYRNSFFKSRAGKSLVITRVCFAVSKNDKPHIAYKDIELFIKKHSGIALSPHILRETVLSIRAQKLPDPKKIGTAGSFFKNPIISGDDFKNLQKKFPDLPQFPAEKGYVKVSAGWLLDKVCNFKGVSRDNVGVYKNQALVIVAQGGATASSVDTLAHDMQTCVKEKTGINLEREVEYVGTF